MWAAATAMMYGGDGRPVLAAHRSPTKTLPDVVMRRAVRRQQIDPDRRPGIGARGAHPCPANRLPRTDEPLRHYEHDRPGPGSIDITAADRHTVSCESESSPEGERHPHTSSSCRPVRRHVVDNLHLEGLHRRSGCDPVQGLGSSRPHIAARDRR